MLLICICDFVEIIQVSNWKYVWWSIYQIHLLVYNVSQGKEKQNLNLSWLLDASWNSILFNKFFFVQTKDIF